MKKILIIAALVGITGVVINFSLGGFEPIEPSLVSVEQAVIYGKSYEGGYGSDELSSLISELKSELDDAGQPGILTIVNYDQPDLELRGMVKQFVGIIWQKEYSSATYDSLVLPATNAAQFNIPVKPLVMPSPVKLKNLAEEFAAQMETELAGYSIEQYQNKSLIINYPLK